MDVAMIFLVLYVKVQGAVLFARMLDMAAAGPKDLSSRATVFCTESISWLLTCLTESPTALMSFKSWPWRSRRRSDTRTPTSTGPLRTARSFRQLGAFGRWVIPNSPCETRWLSSYLAMKALWQGHNAVVGFLRTTISGRQATRGGASCRCWWNTPTDSKAPWTLCVSLFTLHPHVNQEPLQVDRVPPFPAFGPPGQKTPRQLRSRNGPPDPCGVAGWIRRLCR